VHYTVTYEIGLHIGLDKVEIFPEHNFLKKDFMLWVDCLSDFLPVLMELRAKQFFPSVTAQH